MTIREDSDQERGLTSVQALDVAIDAIKADIRHVKFSKVYRLGLPGPVARLDTLEQARETLESLRELLAERQERSE